jgi:hypothetical protein
MFFSISKKENTKFKNHFKFEDIFIDFDDSWEIFKDDNKIKICKGYLEDFSNLNDENDYFSKKGNFCVIQIENSQITIMHQYFRTFPLYISSFFVSNMPNDEHSQCDEVKADTYLTIEIENFEIKSHKINNDYSIIQTTDYLKEVYDLLIQKFLFLKNSKLDLKLFFSKGVDTGLAMSIMNKLEIPYELILDEHISQCELYDNILEISKDHYKFTTYKQIHHFDEKCILISGVFGDDSFLREVGQLSIYFRAKKINIYKFLNKDNRNYYYFNRKKLTDYFVDNLKRRVYNGDYVEDICNVMMNNHQHWHINNTLTFTPFQDIEILRMTLGLSDEKLLDQILNCNINIELIKMFDPNVLTIIEKYKNFREGRDG